MFKRSVLGLMVMSMVLAILSGCGEKKTISSTTETELTYWGVLNPNVSANFANLGDTPMAKNIEKLTGIKVKYIHPAQGQQVEQFNLLLSSRQMPDMIEFNWYSFAGGPEKAINDGYILRLNDLLDKSAPNLKKYLSENLDIDKMVVTDEGNYYVFPFIRGDDLLKIASGPIVRKDWLDELNLSVPETIDDWHTMLTEFKNKKGANAPFATITGNNVFKTDLLANGCFVGAYGILGNYYVENGKVVYGFSRDEYKTFLDTFSKWREEGLIDPDFATTTSPNLDTYMLTDKTGATIGWAGSGLGKGMLEGVKTNTEFNLVPAPYPVLQRGDKPKFGQKDLSYITNASVAITTHCKNPELAAKFLDFGYGDEGMLAYNFGIEGESYEMVSNSPKYTDLIMKNPEGLSVVHAMSKYIRGNYNGPFVQMKEYVEQYYALPQQKDALTVWNTDMEKYTLPRVTFTSEESDKIARAQQNIDKHVSEYSLNVIMGNTTTADFDAYVKQLKDYGLDELLEIYNKALERYEQR